MQFRLSFCIPSPSVVRIDTTLQRPLPVCAVRLLYCAFNCNVLREIMPRFFSYPNLRIFFQGLKKNLKFYFYFSHYTTAYFPLFIRVSILAISKKFALFYKKKRGGEIIFLWIVTITLLSSDKIDYVTQIIITFNLCDIHYMLADTDWLFYYINYG